MHRLRPPRRDPEQMEVANAISRSSLTSSRSFGSGEPNPRVQLVYTEDEVPGRSSCRQSNSLGQGQEKGSQRAARGGRQPRAKEVSEGSSEIGPELALAEKLLHQLCSSASFGCVCRPNSRRILRTTVKHKIQLTS